MGVGGLISFSKPGGGGSGAELPSGVVGLWPSALAVPSGWVKCNGTNGTVDMQGYYPRGTPDGDTINRTYGSASHTHNAAHSHTGAAASHTHTLAQHCHTVASHTHNIVGHSHTTQSHTHSLASHSHTVQEHCHYGPEHMHYTDDHNHDLTDHCHTKGTLHQPSVYHTVSVGGICDVEDGSLYPVQVITGIWDHPCCYGGGGNTGYMFNAPHNTGNCAPSTDSARDYSYSCICDTTADAFGTGLTLGCAPPATGGVMDTGSYSPSTNDGGAVATGAIAPDADIDSCALVTGSGASIPPTRNVEFIMKL